MATLCPFLLDGGASAAGPFTWGDIPSQVARWDAHIAASITQVSGVTVVADQVSTYDLEIVAVTETGPTYDASDPSFGDAGSITHTSGTDDLRSQLPDTSQPYTVWGVFAIAAGTSAAFWDGGASAPRCGVIEAAQWDESDPVTFYSSSDGTNFLNGQDVFLEGARAVLVIAYFNGAASYVIVDGLTVTMDGSTTGTTLLTDLYVRDNGHRWSIMGVVSGEIDSTTRTNMLALARSERGIEAAWSPLYLGLDGWWRADLGHAHADTDPVTGIANQGTGAAGSDLDLTQATSGLRPTYDASHASFNGQAVIDGNLDVLHTAATTAWHLPSEWSSCTVVSVGRTVSASGFEELFATRAYTAQGGLALRIRAGASCTFTAEESGGVATITDTGANGVQNAVMVLAGVLTGAVTASADSAACWVEGVSGGATTADLDLPVAAAASRELCIGGLVTTAGTLVGQWAEHMFAKRRFTSAEHTQLLAYINTRYAKSLTGVTQ